MKPTNRHRLAAWMSAIVLGVIAGTATSATLYEALFESELGFQITFDNSEESGDQWPTMETDVGPLQAGSHLCDFSVQGHSGVADISRAFVEIINASGQETEYTATYANGGLVTNSEGTLATFSGISIPADCQLARVGYIYSDGECYDFQVEEDQD